MIWAKANQFIGPCSKILQGNETYFKTNFSIKDKYWTGNYVVVTMVACITVGETFKNHRTLAMAAQQYWRKGSLYALICTDKGGEGKKC